MTLRTPAGTQVPAGVHRAEITTAGRKVVGEIVVSVPDRLGKSAAEKQAGAPSTPPEPVPGGLTPQAAEQGSRATPPAFWDKWGTLALVALAPFVLMGLGAWVYLKLIRPRRLMAPLREALALVARKEYEEALPGLTSIESKLTGAARRQARFTIAFCYAATKGYGEAELALSALRRESPGDVDVLCLLAWLKVLQQRYAEAELLLDELVKAGHLDEWQVRRLVSITKLSLANKAFADGHISEAAALFEEVRKLGVFAEHVPADLRNRHVVLGLRALFERDCAGARAQFEEMQASAAALPEEQRTEILAKAKLGLALSYWIEDTPESGAKVEQLLADTIRAIEPKAALEKEWPRSIPQKNLIERLEEAETGTSGPRLTDMQQCVRDVHFLRGVAVLRRWKTLDGKQAHARIEEHYEQTLRRLACALEADPEFRDVYLTAGLLMYYTHTAGETRSAGIELLRKARELGVRDPETLEILAVQDKRERMEADVAAQYMEVLDHYLADETVRNTVRDALMKKLSAFRRFPPAGQRPDFAAARAVEPTVDEIRRRSETLMARLAEVLKARSDGMQKVRVATQALNERSRALSEQAKLIEQSETELLVLTGKALFSDDPEEASEQ
ncbi:MAG: hypothetical protein P4K98_13040 [Bryobacteraceae bacterium]|nr:hypothetical protein [Bryobacteraceae bacterium]